MTISADQITQFKKDGTRLLEHLPKLLLEPENPRLQATLFGLVFESLPTYDEIVVETAKLSWIFGLSLEIDDSESWYVRLQSLSWNHIEETIEKWRTAFQELEWSGLLKSDERLAA